MAWIVAVTRPTAADEVEAAIKRAGFAVYLPRYRAILRGVRLDVRGRRIRARGNAVVFRPLFGGYLFIGFEVGRGDELLSIAGVAKLMRRPDRSLAKIGDEALEILRERVASGEFNKDIEPGDRVRIGDDAGVWAGLFARLVALDENGQARLMVEMFGRDNVPAVVSSATLRVVVP